MVWYHAVRIEESTLDRLELLNTVKRTFGVRNMAIARLCCWDIGGIVVYRRIAYAVDDHYRMFNTWLAQVLFSRSIQSSAGKSVLSQVH